MSHAKPTPAASIPATRRTVEGHDEILRALSDLEAHLEVEPAPLERYRRGLAGRLDRLGQLLAAHYAWEETSRLYVDVPTRHPEFAADLKGLVGEHDTTLAALDWLKTEVARVADPDAMRRLIPMIEVLATLLRRHEEQEERIIRAVMAAGAWSAARAPDDDD